MGNRLTPTAGEGKDLSDMLRAALGIPEGVQWFEVRFAIREPITVRCEYMATVQTSAQEPEPEDDEPASPNSAHRTLDDE